MSSLRSDDTKGTTDLPSVVPSGLQLNGCCQWWPDFDLSPSAALWSFGRAYDVTVTDRQLGTVDIACGCGRSWWVHALRPSSSVIRARPNDCCDSTRQFTGDPEPTSGVLISPP